MRQKKRGEKILESRLIVALIFVMLFMFSLSFVKAGDVIVKDGNLYVDNNLNSSGVLFVNSTSGRVGVGTTTPSAKLDVQGSVNIGNPIYTYSALNVNSSGNVASFMSRGIGVGASSDINFGEGSDPYTHRMGVLRYNNGGGTSSLSKIKLFSYGGSEAAFVITGDNNVGIGTVSPSSTLQVVGNASFATTSGNVGIGTTSPTSKLEVNGNITLIAPSSSNGVSVIEIKNQDYNPETSTGSKVNEMFSATSGDRSYQIQTYNAGGTTYGGLNLQTLGGYVTIGGTTFGTGYELSVNNDIYAGGNVSALVFIDRTQFPKEGYDALSDIMKIKSDENGNLNHSTLPDIARVKNMTMIKDGNIVNFEGRDLGMSISINTVAIQQLNNKIIALEQEKEELKKALCEIKPELELCR